MLVVSSENSGCDLIFLVSRNRCLNLTLSAFTTFLCSDLESMSRPLFCCDVIQLPLAFEQVVTQNMLLCLFSCHDQVFSLITAILVATSKSMSRPSLLPIQSQPHFSVSTVPFNFYISGRDLTILLYFGIYVATSI